MIKPKKLKSGDKVAIVSLSWGGMGDEQFIHKYNIAKDRLESEFGLEAVTMPHALKGSEFIYNHPELRAKDLMDAFEDHTIKGIFCAIGGDDSIRILPYINYESIKNNPKIFMGYSDTTVSHFMMNKAGLISFYGPSIMSEFGEYVNMFDYTHSAVINILFKDSKNYEIPSSDVWSKDNVSWKEENMSIAKSLIPEEHHYEILSGQGKIAGNLIGGCIDVFPMIIGTEIWPDLNGWKNRFLLIETSENKMHPDYLLYYLRNLGAQGILSVIHGIVVGKPQDEQYYNEYKKIYLKVLQEYQCEELPIIYNVNIGHAFGTGILPLGVMYEIDIDNKIIKLIESATN